MPQQEWLVRLREKDPQKARLIEANILRGSYNRVKRHKLIEKLCIEKKMGAVEIHHEMCRRIEAKDPGWEECVNGEGSLVAWSVATIQKDLNSMRKFWNGVVEKSVVNHRSSLVQELESVKKKGWEESNMKVVVSAIDRQVEILGLKQPERVEVKHGIEDEWAQKIEEARKRIAERDAARNAAKASEVIDAEVVK